MSRSHLRACPSCARHVRVSEASCPFCATALSDAFRATPPAQPPGVRLTRAALFAFGTGTLAVAAGGCSDGTTATPFYGASPIEVTSDAGDAGPSVGEALYGAPPIEQDASGPLGEDGGDASPPQK